MSLNVEFLNIKLSNCIKEITRLTSIDTMTKTVNNTDSDESNEKQSRKMPDGTYNNKPIDPEYFKNYYRKHYSCQYTCLICGKELNNIQKIKRHEMTKFCLKARNTLAA